LAEARSLGSRPTTLKQIDHSKEKRTTRKKTSKASLNAQVPLEAFCWLMICAVEVPVVAASKRSRREG
jgi:hypothetical protein